MMKRSRAPNFTTAEIMLLLRLVEKYPIIENKKTDGATAKEKQEARQTLPLEYNSQTNYSPRNTENLQACYKNQKIKVKKIHSSEKMTIKAPLLLQAMEEYGQDWEKVAKSTNESIKECQNSFKTLVAATKKEEASHKREINRTGGGPAPQPSRSNNDQTIIDKVKTLIEPSLEGLYTMYDGDAVFMEEQQLLTPTESQICPIESEGINKSKIENDTTPLRSNKDLSRLDSLKKKIDPSLESLKKGKKKLNVCHSFQELADDKKDLVKAQKTLAEYQQKLLIELVKEKLQYEKKKNEMELTFLKQKHELELDLLRNKKL